ncbi:helix-turn-helix domain-containing protein [Streptomyces sp. NPDC001404]|uniref:helix-turn-helix domain-containing protein n=1 Tax=Streptomyces sp. NPDC001404 TaxID=3364571 RepID=UPI0036A4239A
MTTTSTPPAPSTAPLSAHPLRTVPAAAVVIGAYLRHLRERRGATLADAAHKTGMSPSNMSRLERAHIPLEWRTVACLLRWHSISTPIQRAIEALVIQAQGEDTRQHSGDAGPGWQERLGIVERQATAMTVSSASYANADGQLRRRLMDQIRDHAETPERSLELLNQAPAASPRRAEAARRQDHLGALYASIDFARDGQAHRFDFTSAAGSPGPSPTQEPAEGPASEEVTA